MVFSKNLDDSKEKEENIKEKKSINKNSSDDLNFSSSKKDNENLYIKEDEKENKCTGHEGDNGKEINKKEKGNLKNRKIQKI